MHSYGGTAAIWKHPIDSPPPAKRTRRFASPQGKHSGVFAWLVVFEVLQLCYCLIFIDHFLAYMHICRIHVYKKYTRVGDFDTPTHQPTSTSMQCEKVLQTWKYPKQQREGEQLERVQNLTLRMCLKGHIQDHTSACMWQQYHR